MQSLMHLGIQWRTRIRSETELVRATVCFSIPCRVPQFAGTQGNLCLEHYRCTVNASSFLLPRLPMNQVLRWTNCQGWRGWRIPQPFGVVVECKTGLLSTVGYQIYPHLPPASGVMSSWGRSLCVSSVKQCLPSCPFYLVPSQDKPGIFEGPGLGFFQDNV